MFALLLPATAWAEQCNTADNFAALVELVVDAGRTTDYGITLANEQKSRKYYAALVRGDLPELHLTQQSWHRRWRQERVDLWIMRFTVYDTYIVHKQLVEKNHRLVREKRLSSKGVDAVECNVFHAFLGTLRTSP